MSASQYIGFEQINIEEIIRAAKKIPKTLCDTSVIYFLLDKGEIIYVGQTKQLLARLAAHMTDKTFDSYAAFPVPASEANDAEAAMIVRFNPPLNKGVPVQRRYVSYDRLKRLYGLPKKKVQALIGKECFVISGVLYVEMNEEKYSILKGETI